jgi:hypothetical protein
MKAWRPFHRGLMIVAPRVGSGKTASGLHVEVGMYNRDVTRRTKMIAEVLSTFGCDQVKPGDTVVYRYGAENTVRDSEGEELTFLSEKHCILAK